MAIKRRRDPAKARLQRLGRLVDGSSPVVFLWRIGPKRRTVETVSAGAKRMLGYTPGEFQSGRVSLHGIAHPEDAPSLERELADRLKAGSDDWTQEYRLIAKDGRTVWVKDWRRVLRNAKGRATHVQAIVSDITECKSREHLLAIQRDLLLALSGRRSLADTLRLCLEAAFQVSGLDSGGVYLTDDEGGLRLEQSVGLSGEFTTASAYFSSATANTRLVMSGRPVYSRYTDLKGRLSEAERQEALRALAVIPIRHESRIIGSMNVASHSMEAVPEHGRVSLETIASTAALLITRARADEALRASREQMRALATRLQAVQEGERRRMARAVHDELSQSLAALGMVLRTIENEMETMKPEPVIGKLTDRIVTASNMVGDLGEAVQRLGAGLRPPVLDELGLASAMRREAEGFRQRTGLAGRIRIAARDARLSPDLATALFRILQEALSNVARHAQAREVDVRFGRVQGAWQLDVVDNGRGIEAAALRRNDAFGLIGMRERAESFGGILTIERRAEGGTALRVRIPAGRSEATPS